MCECLSHFFFNDTATTEIYTLSLHDALPISDLRDVGKAPVVRRAFEACGKLSTAEHRPIPYIRWWLDGDPGSVGDRKSTRLNSSHANISYAVFCLKKKKHHDTPFVAAYVYCM